MKHLFFLDSRFCAAVAAIILLSNTGIIIPRYSASSQKYYTIQWNVPITSHKKNSHVSTVKPLSQHLLPRFRIYLTSLQHFSPTDLKAFGKCTQLCSSGHKSTEENKWLTQKSLIRQSRARSKTENQLRLPLHKSTQERVHKLCMHRLEMRTYF